MQAASLPVEFSFRTREQSLARLESEQFDFLIIGGGITGAGVARDAVRRGLKVALIEQGDFASGTSSASSKLIHGGLRYLETFEFGLVFEALSERAHLLKSVPHLVHPLKFYFPVYEGDRNGKFVLSLGMWLYDLLSLFRAPGFHKRYSARGLSREIPFLKKAGLRGGFSYFDASMRDDVMAMEIMRAAASNGAVVANYVKATAPIWEHDLITGFEAVDVESGKPIRIRARRTIVCAGPWTDILGKTLSADWKPWLTPSKGIHLVFDLNRIPVPGAVVMSHPKDGRISFVIPRPDLATEPGKGLVIVGTTDSPSPADPARVSVDQNDVDYLIELLKIYFPDLKISTSDILSSYVGVRPLVGADRDVPGGGSLQKVSREHRIDQGPGGATFVAGGKYTTYRKMAEEVVDFTLTHWKRDAESKKAGSPPSLRPANTMEPIAPVVSDGNSLEARLRHSIRTEMTLHLSDFYFRRTPLFLSRADHGLPESDALSRVWAEERGLSESIREKELASLQAGISARALPQGT